MPTNNKSDATKALEDLSSAIASFDPNDLGYKIKPLGNNSVQKNDCLDRWEATAALYTYKNGKKIDRRKKLTENLIALQKAVRDEYQAALALKDQRSIDINQIKRTTELLNLTRKAIEDIAWKCGTDQDTDFYLPHLKARQELLQKYQHDVLKLSPGKKFIIILSTIIASIAGLIGGAIAGMVIGGLVGGAAGTVLPGAGNIVGGILGSGVGAIVCAGTGLKIGAAIGGGIGAGIASIGCGTGAGFLTRFGFFQRNAYAISKNLEELIDQDKKHRPKRGEKSFSL